MTTSIKMSHIDPKTLHEDERWLLYCSYLCQLNINRGLAEAAKHPIPSAKTMKRVKQTIKDFPEYFQWDEQTMELGILSCKIRYGIVPNEKAISEEVSRASASPINETRN